MTEYNVRAIVYHRMGKEIDIATSFAKTMLHSPWHVLIATTFRTGVHRYNHDVAGLGELFHELFRALHVVY